MNNFEHARISPKIGNETKVAQQAVIAGHVILGSQCSIFPYAVLRGDVNCITVGNQTNIQENSVVHVSLNTETYIGNRVTVGHGAIVHGCRVESDCLIGMHATLLDGAVIGHHCIIGANALVTQNKVIPPYSLVLGSPGKVVRPLTPEDIALIEESAKVYLEGLPYFNF
jgi:carbonic anhydrase/acetyltransferase-like protein (isoleucine patch superfamily)